jgi:hypothetical protein
MHPHHLPIPEHWTVPLTRFSSTLRFDHGFIRTLNRHVAANDIALLTRTLCATPSYLMNRLASQQERALLKPCSLQTSRRRP